MNDTPSEATSEAAQEEFFGLYGAMANARAELIEAGMPDAVYVVGEEEWDEIPKHLHEEVVIYSTDDPEDEEIAAFESDEERLAQNRLVLAVADVICKERDLAFFWGQHKDKSFRVFKREWLEAAVTDDFEPLF